MKLLGNRLLVRPVRVESELINTDAEDNASQYISAMQEYTVTHVGDQVTDDRFVEGTDVIVPDAIVSRQFGAGMFLIVEEQKHLVVTPDNIIALPSNIK